MTAARCSHAADPIRAAAVEPGPRLQPADPQVDIDERGRIGRLGRHAEVERGNEDAALGECPGDEVIVGPVLVDPGAAMHLNNRRVRPGTHRPVEPRQ